MPNGPGPRHQTVQLRERQIELEFHAPDGIPIRDAATLLQSLETVFTALWFLALAEKEERLYWLHRLDGMQHSGEVYIAEMYYGSPWLVVLQTATKLPAAAAQAIQKFFKNLIFYNEERSRRQAEAAEKWEDVLAKRIKNVREIVDLLGDVYPNTEQKRQLVERILQSTSDLEKSPAKLVGFRMKQD